MCVYVCVCVCGGGLFWFVCFVFGFERQYCNVCQLQDSYLDMTEWLSKQSMTDVSALRLRNCDLSYRTAKLSAAAMSTMDILFTEYELPVSSAVGMFI